jgi:hypothetical protein
MHKKIQTPQWVSKRTCRINIYLKRLVDSKDNITEEVAAEKQAYKVVTQKVDVGGI